ncbi:MAG: translocation/assembly module TamB, partial [Candidatus Latescibacterota bacterium]
VEDLPVLSGIELILAGALVFKPELSASVTGEIMANDWIDNSTVSFDYSQGLLTVDTLSVALQGLELTANGRVTPDSTAVRGDIRIEGTSWLDTFVPDHGVPDDLSATIRTDVVGLHDRNAIVADVDAAGAFGGVEFDALQIDTELELDERKPSRLLVMANVMDLNIGLGAVVDRRTGIDARVSPIVIKDTAIPKGLMRATGEKAGRFRFVTRTGELLAENVTITGDQGDIHINASRDGLGTGEFDVRCVWAEPPTLIVDSFGFADSTADELRSAWRRDAPFEFTTTGLFDTRDSLEVSSSGNFKLPGPRVLATLLPDSSRVDDLGPLEGLFELTAASAPDGLGFGVVLDLGSTAWIDSSAVSARGVGGNVVVDTAGVAVTGVHAGLRGALDDGIYDLRGVVDVTDAAFVQRFVQAVPDLTLRVEASFRGTPENPNLTAAIDGSVRGDAYEIPSLAATIDVADDGLNATAQLPRGLVTSQVILSKVTMSASSAGRENELLPVVLALDAEGQDLSLHKIMRVDTTGGLNLDVDTLAFDVRGQNLRSTGPFQIRVFSESNTITIGDLDLEGSIGKINITGFANPDSSDLTGVVNITLPEEPPSIPIRRHLWPERIDADFRAVGKHDVNARLHVDGFTLVDDSRPTLDLELIGRSGDLQAKLLMADSAGAVFRGVARVPGSVVVYPPSTDLGDGPVSLDIELDRVPMVARLVGRSRQIPKDEIVHVSGAVKLRGTAAAPQGVLNLTADFSGWPKMSVYDLAVGAVLTNGGIVDSEVTAVLERSTSLPDGPFEEGVTASMQLLRSGQPVLSADATYPKTLSLDPPALRTIEKRDLHARVVGDAIPLADFDPLLPLDVSLGGLLNLSFTIEGPPDDPSIGGGAKATDLETKVAQKGEMLAQADLQVAGTRLRPVVRGDIQIDNALIRVPDLPKDLHPMDGGAILAREDTADTEEPVELGPESQPEPASDTGEVDDDDGPDIEVIIRIPDGFWIRGKGLDIELRGDLMIVQRRGVPVVTGELRAIRGTLVTLGRTLQLERGTVTFFGGDEINPSLDIVLTTRIEDTDVKILFGGTVNKPQINLNSIPEMREADIMSLLLFGSDYQNLDDSQADLVRQRSTEMIASVGAVKLQEQLGDQMGIDVVKVKSTGRDDQSSALSFGKYISPRVLLSYAYALDSSAESFISVEYFIRGGFKVESTFGNRKGQSSLGVGWVKDY